MKKLLLVCILILLIAVCQNAEAEFTEYSTYTVDHGPECICPADIDGDGDQDLVMVCNGDLMTSASSICYLINDGSEGFEVKKENRTNKPYLLDISDMDNDGDPDMVILDNESMTLLTNDGSGDFTLAWSYEMSTFFLSSLKTLDLNGDGLNDIVFFDSIDLDLFLTGGSERYKHETQQLNQTSSISWNDMDGDGDIDMFTTYAGMKLFGEMVDTPNIEVYYNFGNGSFERGFWYEPEFMGGINTVGRYKGEITTFIQDIENEDIEIFQWINSDLNRIGEISSGESYDSVREMECFDMDDDGNEELIIVRSTLQKTLVQIYDDFVGGEITITEFEVLSQSTDFCIFNANTDGNWDIAGIQGSYLMTAGNKAWVALNKTTEPDEETLPENTEDSIKPDSNGEDFPISYLILAILLLLAVVVIVTVLIIVKRKRSSIGPSAKETPSPDSNIMQFKCFNCNNLLQVVDIGMTMNVTCPFCSSVLTIDSKKGAMPQPSTPPGDVQISCPNCKKIFTTTKTGDIMNVQCPFCGATGTLRG